MQPKGSWQLPASPGEGGTEVEVKIAPSIMLGLRNCGTVRHVIMLGGKINGKMAKSIEPHLRVFRAKTGSAKPTWFMSSGSLTYRTLPVMIYTSFTTATWSAEEVRRALSTIAVNKL